MDVLRLHAGTLEGHVDALGLALRVGQDGVGGVGIDAPAGDLGDDAGTAGEGVVEALEDVDGAAFGDDDTVAVLVEGTGGLGGVFMGAERPLVLEAGEDAEGVNRFGDAAGEGDVDLAELQHLGGLDEAGVARGAGGADGVMRAGDAHVHRDLAGRVVRHGAGVVMVRPVFGVVAELGDIVNLVLGLDVPVLGDAEVDADAGLVDFVPVEAGVAECFAGTEDGNRPDAGTNAEFLPLLPLVGIEVAHAGGMLAHVADVDHGDAGLAGEQVGPELSQRVAVGGGEAEAGDDDAGLGGHLTSFHQVPAGHEVKPRSPLALANWPPCHSLKADVPADQVFALRGGRHGPPLPGRPWQCHEGASL